VHVDAGRIVDQLAAQGFQRILCEGGPSIHYGLVVTGRLDELCLTISPQLAGGDPLRIRAGANRVRGAVPPRGVRPRGGHRQRRRARRQLRL